MDGTKSGLSWRLWRRAACYIVAGLLLGGVAQGGGAAGWQLFDVYVDGKYGLIDQSGAMVAEPQFTVVRPLGEGMIGAKLAATGEWVCIDAAGDIVASTKSAIPAFFSDGLAPVKAGGLYGYMDRAGKVVIQPAFEQAFPFRDGRAMVVKDGFVCYINADGKVIERLPFLRPSGAKADCVTETGTVLGQVYLDFWEEGGDRIPFERGGKMGFLDRRGEVAIKPVYATANQYVFRPGSFFNEKIMPVRLGRVGFIDRQGNLAVDFIFDRAEPFCEGLSAVGKDGRYGFIDSDGKIVVPLRYEYVENFSEGLAAVRVNGRWGFIDKTGRMVIEPAYLGLRWGVPMRFTEGLAVVRTEAGTGYINKANAMVVPPVYWHGDDFSGGLAKVYRKRSLEFEYVNRQGETVWPLGR